MILFLIGFISNVKAQVATISGTVTDKNGPLPGVTVSIKGSKVGTATDINGSYSLKLTAGLSQLNSTIEFKSIGYNTIEKPLNGDTTISVVMNEEEKILGEVVVTALGIKREDKALGYAAQSINSKQVTEARSNNWVSSLSGKVAGLNLISTGSGPLNSTRITLRGDNSLNPNGNNALIVLDGVPMSSSMTSAGVTNAYGAGSGNDVPIDFGNGVSDINPDDIEAITVLKGASATALYGSRAANGALIITTKSGARKNKGLGVTVSSNTSFNDVLKWPDYQHEYGQGVGKTLTPAKDLYYSYGATADGASTGGTSSAFGPKFNGQSYFQYNPATQAGGVDRVLWQPYKNNISDFWRTGSTITNSISLEGGNEKGSARASLTHTKNNWIMPNTGFKRITAAVSLNYNVSEKLKIASKVNYTNKQSDNLPATGYNNQSISYFMIFQNPNVDLSWYAPRWKNGKYEVDQIHPFSTFIDNPYVIAYEMTNKMNNNQVVGNVSATYEFSPKLNLMVRSGIDMNNETRAQQRPFSTANFQNGYFKQQNISNYEVNTDGLLTYKDKFLSIVDLTASVGGNTMSRKYNGVNGYVDGLVIPGIYKLSNGINSPTMSTNIQNKMVNSLYGMASLGYKGKIYLDFTGRNDWSSALPIQNNSFFYPSVSSSFILNELFKLPMEVSFAKLRVSAAQVGNDTNPYKTSKYYGASEFPGSGSVSTTLYNVNFKPELTTSYEAGLDVRMFGGQLGIDATVYNNYTQNQILDVPLEPSTGYFAAVLNAGKVRNQGVELMLNVKPFDKAFKWSSTITWAKNKNKVLELAEGMIDQQVIGYGGNATLIAKVGGSTGDIYGFGFLRSPEGKVIYGTDGLPARPDEIQYIGNAYADWKGGFSNEFAYKNFRLSILVDGQYGGLIYSQTHHKMSEQGKLKHTLVGREEGYIIGDGVVKNADGAYAPNTTKVAVGYYYADYYRRANVEANSFDASFLKLREVRLEYNLPKKWLNKVFVNQASVALYGRDLAMATNFPMFDPETAALNGSTILPGVEMGQLPTPRTFGMNLTLKF
ncbi:SusC/RagA family TonB-linked outer membrane protein [Solitalea lacus]|uniref:SusC/RagA family TonB-linked outer membrane protein n=1 Tax=Solitalea lacus TaxID=2911172 RepID=UPI001EDBB0E3|nr:SusC/RagA family TonB-linked outer membrane protein [Solitalea lacus]UKJ08609.1 SusC/RagA family TonB-linked outer membrane protein [Solitalea lacus]